MNKLNVIALATFGLGLLSTGAAHATFTMACNNNMRATWAGGAFGRVTQFNRTMIRRSVGNFPETTLSCMRQATTPSVVTEVIQLSPGSIPALCGGRANVEGIAIVNGTVPPFGGFPFVSGRIDAIPTYNQATGRCQLDLPVTNLLLFETVTQACTPVAINGWNCPDNTQPASTSLGDAEPLGSTSPGGAESLASLFAPRSPEIFRVLSQYESFKSPPFLALSTVR